MSSPLNKILGVEENSTATSVSIQIASPEVIRAWSRGEVKNPETINYRSFKPEKGGLFCERIFGPNKDWECSCGKYKRIKHKGVVCDRCGVEVTHSRVRRERMGHIELAVPVTHVWFFKCIPSRVGLVLDLTVKNMERVIYYEDWIVTDPGETPLEYQQILTDREYREAHELYGGSFVAEMGAASAQKLLSKVELEPLLEELKVEMQGTKSKANRRKIAKRLRLVEGFIRSNTRPEWMVLDVMPVIPPDLRPLVPLEGGRFASSDLNDLYRRVINRNNRLKHLLHLRTPEVIIRNEKRMLQESVDALLDNGRHGRPVTGTGNRPLKSLSDMLKGKSGRFRQNLLGKRVDYSGRSVIVVGPELKLGQCGLPKEMAMVLFEPFIIGQLKTLGYCHTVRSAKKMIDRRDSIVWDVLERVIDGHPVLLNRAPTLHRLSIQAFDPILIEGKAIRLHPLVCSAYNADFDGDQMAVHVQLSNEAQLEAKLLMMANLNIFSPADGRPITTPTQDITLGIYYMTYYPRECAENSIRSYSETNEALHAYESGIIHIHDLIEVPNPDYGQETCWGDAGARTIRTTVGRLLFNEIWTEGLGFFNEAVPKKVLSNMVSDAYPIIKREGVVIMLDKLKELGYEFATRSGFSIGITDMIIPDNKSEILDAATAEVTKVRHQREEGVITNLERYNKCIDIWTQANNSLANTLYDTLKNNDGGREINPVYAMLDSGARGSRDQIRQLAGMRGLMAKPNGDIIERPILSNFREGLDVLEYFISSHGARKGLADTALKTADSGYMTRKLVDVAQDVICSEDDCGTVQGILVKPIVDGEETMLPLEDRIIGRFASEDIKHPLNDGEFIVRASELITKDVVEVIEEMGIDEVLIRSALTCESDKGICGKCYGLSMDDVNKKAEIGSSLGIIAAQSIGEPGTQLTMRTFHLGGTASATFKKPVHEARAEGKMELVNARTVEQEDGTLVVLNKHANVILVNEKGLEVENNKLFPGTILYKKEGEKVEIGEKYAQWDAYNVPIITEFAGQVEYKNLVDGVTMNRVRNKKTNAMEISVLEHHGDLHPQLVLLDSEGVMIDHYSLPGGTTVSVEDGDLVKAGSTVARTPRQSSKTKDITGGLPRVAELLEARKPKEPAEIARIDGIVELGDTSRTNKRTIIIRDPESGMEEKHLIQPGKRIVAYNGDYVRKGQPITDGAVVPHDILEVCGAQDLQEYLVNEVQMVYRLQGVAINDKHVEIIVRQMLRKVKVSEAGTTKFIYGEQVDKKNFYAENERVIAEGGQPAEAEPVLLGITKASLETESFISAASFQDTTRILTDAATFGKVDTLVGFKENVIMGQLIPAGTGHDSATSFIVHKNIASPAGVEILEEESKIAEEARKEVDAIANAKALLDL